MTTVTLKKEDFTQGALDLGIWDALTHDDENVEEVEVRVMVRYPTGSNK